MRPVNQRTKQILLSLIAGLDNPGDSRKLDNAPGAFMALCVECIGPRFYSLAHYGEQHGDAMRDPDVVFWIGPSGDAFPIAFRNNYAGVDREYVEFENGAPVRIAPKAQADLAAFCGTWLRNVKAQQGL